MGIYWAVLVGFSCGWEDGAVRLIWCRFPQMFENVGIANSAGIATALLVVVSLIPTAVLQWKGHLMRGNMKARI